MAAAPVHVLLGRSLVRLRMEAGMTQEQLAEKADISHRYLQSLEAGQKQPSINVVAQLRAAVECSWDELLKGV